MAYRDLPPSYDRWKTSVPDDPPVVRQCDCCGENMYEGQEALELISGAVICYDCFLTQAEKELQPTTVIIRGDK